MIRRVAALLLLIWPAIGHAQDSLSREVATAVKDLCRGSSAEGIQREHDGGTSVALRQSDSRLSFSEHEWEGIQQVLPEHQAQDSADYRNCVVALTPTFTEAEREERERRRSSEEHTDGDTDPELCEFRNDGECDEPYACPVGTDTADCSGQIPFDQQVFQPLQSQLFCCDTFGRKWCPMVSGATYPGDFCICAGVPGSGFQCY